MPSCRWPRPFLLSSLGPACLPAGRIALDLSVSLATCRHADGRGHALSHLLNLPACLPAGSPFSTSNISFSFADMPSCRWPRPFLLSSVGTACLPAGRIAFFNATFLFSRIPCSPLLCLAGMPDAGLLPLSPLYLIRRRHAGMPDVVVMPSVSRPAPACRHAGRGSHAFIISSGVGFMLSVSRPAPICRHAGHGCHPSVCGPAPACRHAGRGSRALCISSGAGMPACQTW